VKQIDKGKKNKMKSHGELTANMAHNISQDFTERQYKDLVRRKY
jgi:hypothetical protein